MQFDRCRVIARCIKAICANTTYIRKRELCKIAKIEQKWRTSTVTHLVANRNERQLTSSCSISRQTKGVRKKIIREDDKFLSREENTTVDRLITYSKSLDTHSETSSAFRQALCFSLHCCCTAERITTRVGGVQVQQQKFITPATDQRWKWRENVPSGSQSTATRERTKEANRCPQWQPSENTTRGPV